jgi:hypothetical protein
MRNYPELSWKSTTCASLISDSPEWFFAARERKEHRETRFHVICFLLCSFAILFGRVWLAAAHRQQQTNIQ